MARYITSEEKYRTKITKLYEEAKNKVSKYSLEDFKINEHLNFTHVSWKGTYCKGGNSLMETVELINKYIDESRKPWLQRDLSWLHLV